MEHPLLSLIHGPQEALPDHLPCPADAIRAALKIVITSNQFAKAHRCTSLLTYLIERALDRRETASPPEHEIGIAVFGRDRHAYFPADDPIVRVQAGRLRLRLAAYYGDEGAADPLRITVPVGSYQARIALAGRPPAAAVANKAPMLMFSPLICLSAEAPAGHFTAGLNDELGFRLFRDMRPFGLLRHDSAAHPAGQLLEGTVRLDAARLRVSLHLQRGQEGTVLWYAQFDSTADCSITGQEQMAERCMQALHQHMQG